MNTTVYDFATLVEKDDRFDRPTFSLPPTRAPIAPKPAQPRLPVLSSESPAEALALGVLSQAAHDLRRYHRASGGLERQIYLDAFSWISIDDFEWPYSFVNICQILRADPASMREELLADISLGWLGHWVRLSGRLSRLLRDSIARLFSRSQVPVNFSPSSSVDSFQVL